MNSNLFQNDFSFDIKTCINDNQDSDLSDHNFCNNFLWVNFAENFLPKIERMINEKIDSSNYKEILSNKLQDYGFKIDDFILNTKNYPYLSDFLESAKNYPEKMYQIIFDDMLDLNNRELLKKFDLLIPKDFSQNEILTAQNIDFNKYFEIKNVIHDGFKEFFNYSKNQIINNLGISNIDFVDIIHVAKESLKLFEKFNIDEDNFSERFQNLSAKMNEYILINSQSRANKIDIDKIFAIVFSGENCTNNLFCDFDQTEKFNIKIPDNECESCPKFSLMRFTGHPETMFSTGCHAGLVYSPEISKKLFLILLEHTLLNQNEKLEIVADMPVCVEKRFEILFEFLINKNLNSNEEFKNFVSNTKYFELYDEFDEYFKKYIKYSGQDIMKHFYSKHFFDENSKNFHLSIAKPQSLVSDLSLACKIPKLFTQNMINGLGGCINAHNFYINEVTGKPDHEVGKTWLRNESELFCEQKKEFFI